MKRLDTWAIWALIFLTGFTTKENEFRWEFCWVSSEGAFGGICFGISLLTVCMFM